VDLSSSEDISMTVGDKKVNLLDISIGGAKISHRGALDVTSGDLFSVKLLMDEKEFPLEARVLRTWHPSTEAGSLIEYVSLEFLNTDKRLQDLIGKKIRNIERMQRLKELYR